MDIEKQYVNLLKKKIISDGRDKIFEFITKFAYLRLAITFLMDGTTNTKQILSNVLKLIETLKLI